MTFQRLFIAFALVLLLAAGWRYREPLLAWVNPADTAKPPPFQFDNGTVRTYAPPASAAPQAQADVRPGGLRKCVQGKSVVYTDQPCPQGAREQGLTRGTVNAVPGQRPAPAGDADAAGPASALPPQTKTLRDAMLGPPVKNDLRDQAIERTINR